MPEGRESTPRQEHVHPKEGRLAHSRLGTACDSSLNISVVLQHLRYLSRFELHLCWEPTAYVTIKTFVYSALLKNPVTEREQAP